MKQRVYISIMALCGGVVKIELQDLLQTDSGLVPYLM